jgi:beta-lactamase superfamily II metal-dependent hydrolase
VKLTIIAFQALCGDCLLVSYKPEPDLTTQYMIVDAGFSQTYHRTLANFVRRFVSGGERIDLFVLTHTDNDHLGGAIPFLKEFGSSVVDQFWMNHAPIDFNVDNGGPVGVAQGIGLRDYLITNQKLHTAPVVAGQRHQFGELTVSILSPDAAQYERLLTKWEAHETAVKSRAQAVASTTNDHRVPIEQLIQRSFIPDASWSNRSSIAFLLTIGRFNGLFMGDAHADVVAASLRDMGYSEQNPVQVDFMKVSHHGSKGNSSDNLLSFINCQHYLISTNGVNQHGLPHKEALARVVMAARRCRPNERVHFYFTYNDPILRSIFTQSEIDQYGITGHYPSLQDNCITLTYDC